MNRLTSALEEIFGDGVLLPAATSSSGGETIELLNTPNILNYISSLNKINNLSFNKGNGELKAWESDQPEVLKFIERG